MARIPQIKLNMKVLHICGSYPPMKCGVGDYLFHLSTALSGQGTLENAVLTSSQASSVDTTEHLTVYPIIDNWGIASMPRIARFIRQWDPDIVHIQYPSQGYAQGGGRLRSLCVALLPLLAYACGKRVIQTWHEYTADTFGSALNFLIRALAPSRLIVVRPDFSTNAGPLVRTLARIKSATFIHNASAIPKHRFTSERLREARSAFLQGQKRLLVFFGFLYPHKGAELLFQIADPATDQLLFVGGYDTDSSYMLEFNKLMSSPAWSGKARLLGYKPIEEVSLILSIADAVILPFRTGGGVWNTSLHAAITHHRFVITTSSTQIGYDEATHVYYCPVDDVALMKQALDSQPSASGATAHDDTPDEWINIARHHITLYHGLPQPGHEP
jgi:glycosyltransferase involved in cell wall biosynthesis